MTDIRPLPLGRSTFSALRQENAIYIDKTDLIYDLCRYCSKIFLARPRRFGKSLLVSTFESLFKYGLRDFSGLAVEKLWSDQTYKVVRLDFSEIFEFESPDVFNERFLKLISRVFYEDAGYDGTPDLLNLSIWLSKQPANSIVLLIDEYDAPLSACLDKPEIFSSVQKILNQFFLTLKTREGCLRFFFMTGITKFANTGIFSGFNNLRDISLSSTYGALLGYTEEEITRHFGFYISKAAEALNCSQEEIIRLLRENYDGFCFDQQASTHVFCPWSVLNFFTDPTQGFINYWYRSGGHPKALENYLHFHSLEDPSKFNEIRALSIEQLDSSLSLQDVTLEMLLLQSGYLTIKKLLTPDYVEIGYPNQEVAVSMARLYADELLRGANRIEIGLLDLQKALAEQALENIIDIFNRTFNAIDYQHYPIQNEAACRGIIQALLIGAAMMPLVEVHSARGRSDLEVDAGKRHWVFEIKYARTKTEELKLLDEGRKQMEDRCYGDTPFGQTGKTLMRAVLVFSKSKRRFVKWAAV